MVFSPGNPVFNRTIDVFTYSSMFISASLLLLVYDFGPYAHVFQPIRRATTPKFDQFFGFNEQQVLGFDDEKYRKFLNVKNALSRRIAPQDNYSSHTDIPKVDVDLSKYFTNYSNPPAAESENSASASTPDAAN